MVKPPVLFLCERNAVRSPMAAALLPGAASAGLDPAGWVDPFACAAMLENGVDIATHTPHKVAFTRIAPGTLVIALSIPAFEAAREHREKQGFELDYWDLPAVPGPDGSRDAILEGYRAIRDALKGHLRNRFAHKA